MSIIHTSISVVIVQRYTYDEWPRPNYGGGLGQRGLPCWHLGEDVTGRRDDHDYEAGGFHIMTTGVR